MSGYVLKPADQEIAFAMDWRRGYLADRERITADLGWAVQPRLGAPDDLVVVEQHHDATCSSAVFRGGREGHFYLVSNRIRTNDDRVLSRAIVMRIALAKRPQ